MSYSFYVQNAADLKVEDVFRLCGIPEIKFSERSLKPDTGQWPTGVTHIYQDGVSVRSVEISYEDQVFQSRVFTGSSPDDYRLGINLAAAAAKLCGSDIQPEDGDSVSLNQLSDNYGDQWIEIHSRQATRALIGIFQENTSASLTLEGTRVQMNIGPRFMTPLMADPEGFPEVFWERFRRFNYIDREDVYEAAVVVMTGEENGPELRTTSYGQGVPTLLSVTADVIMLSRSSPLLQTDDGDSTSIYVSVEDLIEALDGRVTWLSETCFLAPAIEGEEWGKLKNLLEPKHVDDMFSLAKVPPKSQANTDQGRGPFSEEEWQQLCMAPSVVFLAVAAADGKVDKKEMTAFSKILESAADDGEGLFHLMLIGAIEGFSQHVNALRDASFDSTENLKSVSEILDRHLSQDDAHTMKANLLKLGVAIAESSGGFLGVFGSKIDKSEKIALAVIAISLGLAKTD